MTRFDQRVRHDLAPAIVRRCKHRPCASGGVHRNTLRDRKKCRHIGHRVGRGRMVTVRSALAFAARSTTARVQAIGDRFGRSGQHPAAQPLPAPRYRSTARRQVGPRSSTSRHADSRTTMVARHSSRAPSLQRRQGVRHFMDQSLRKSDMPSAAGRRVPRANATRTDSPRPRRSAGTPRRSSSAERRAASNAAVNRACLAAAAALTRSVGRWLRSTGPRRRCHLPMRAIRNMFSTLPPPTTF